MTKNKEYLNSTTPLKLNGIQIKLDSNGTVAIEESYIGGILLIIDYDINFTSSKEITRKKLLLKK